MSDAATNYSNIVKTLGVFENPVFENVSRICRRQRDQCAPNRACRAFRRMIRDERGGARTTSSQAIDRESFYHVESEWIFRFNGANSERFSAVME